MLSNCGATSSGGIWVPDVRRYLAQVSRREGTASNLSLSTLGSCKEKLLPVSSRQSSLSLAKPPGTTDSRLWEASRCFNCQRRAKTGGKARSLFLARLRWRSEVRLQVKLGKSSIKLLLRTS